VVDATEISGEGFSTTTVDSGLNLLRATITGAALLAWELPNPVYASPTLREFMVGGIPTHFRLLGRVAHPLNQGEVEHLEIHANYHSATLFEKKKGPPEGALCVATAPPP